MALDAVGRGVRCRIVAALVLVLSRALLGISLPAMSAWSAYCL
jgi:hypothetical protein